MKQLVVRDRVITTDPMTILDKIQRECRNGKLGQFKVSGKGIAVCCPHHNGGGERHPSAFLNVENDEVPYLYWHCFACGSKGSFPKFVAECFNRDTIWGEDWLIANFAEDYVEQSIQLEDIVINRDSEGYFMDDSILNKFEDYHPYMDKRKLTKEVCEKFEVKYDPETRCLVFPVRDSNGRLKFLTRRSVEGRMFHIDSNADKKDVYLLYNIIRNKDRQIYVVESQINALTLECWGYPAIALFGAGTTKEQIDELNKTDVRKYILVYDNDAAGRKGAKRFKQFIRKDVFVDEVWLPETTDVNDYTKEEFDKIVSLQLGF